MIHILSLVANLQSAQQANAHRAALVRLITLVSHIRVLAVGMHN